MIEVVAVGVIVLPHASDAVPSQVYGLAHKYRLSLFSFSLSSLSPVFILQEVVKKTWHCDDLHYRTQVY